MVIKTEIKKNHHYVWGHYLKNWSKDGRNVWYTTKSGRVSLDSVKGFPKQASFYKMGKLSQAHIDAIRHIFQKSPPILQEQHHKILNIFQFIKLLEDAVELNASSINRHEIEALKSNALENLHCFHENNVIHIIKKLSQGDNSVLSDNSNFYNFIIFFGHQITRTKKFRDIINYTTPKKFSQEEKLDAFYLLNQENWWLSSYLIGMNIGHSLLNSRSTDYHCILVNETNTPFITSDQPIINVHPNININSVEPPADNDCDFFYPISPKVAYMINRSNAFPNGVSKPTEDEVDRLNIKMAMLTDLHLMGNEKEVVERYKKLVGFRNNIIKKVYPL
ncbi:DUF4238 domain-containing protein [Bacillus subtilis]|uniref:DUF4238 domain-containing protein n=1 Tax=Pseudochrobactrum asaccharolyticum TaxID=354351 RepID=UPI001F199D91|nr:DUF4238 domain-containing protein [Pseudochrobactrum asaccharolyticum]MCF7646913.1 DUF4238 domain-containing protein [Pseudochrobactrum asaccharolyticum]MCF7673555.1 DUF4238 domain-containing protein [Bacillus subtilis]